jgi:adenine-specific DNA-methyltransferase
MNDFPRVSEGILGEQDIAKTNTELFLSLVGQYFPEAIKDGEVDFSALKEEMGEFAEIGAEHYDFTWAGKQAAKKEAQADLFGRTLRYKPEDSLNPDTTENIYIEGDNLEALKLLRRNYHGKIKMIYIDPPYNTGKDFVYHDSFTITRGELADLSKDTIDGVRYQKNTKESATYHTSWLNMMYTRLKVARELLKEDGSIFISIDDTEVSNLRKLCDDLFGTRNFIAQFTRKGSGGRQDSSYYAVVHEYILCYAKNADCFVSGKMIKDDEVYPFYDEEKQKHYKTQLLRKWGENSRRTDRPNLYYPITDPDGNDHYPMLSDTEEGCWRWGKETMSANIAKGMVEFKKKADKWIAYEKQFEPNEGEYKTKLFTTIIDDISNNTGAALIKELFNAKVFDYPKPVDLLVRILSLANVKEDDIVLDFFSGSATTAQAIFNLNYQSVYNGKRGRVRFILVQLPENCEPNKDAYNSGYTNICEIGKERIRRAGKYEYMSAKAFAGSSLRWNDEKKAELGDEYVCPEDVDIGFKVFEVGGTTIRWNLMSDDELTALEKASNDTELLDFTDGHNDTDIVYEIMLRQYGIPLSTPIEKLDSISGRTYIFADAVVVCLEPKITDELIEKLADIEPTPAKFVLRDSAFGDNIEFKDFSFRKLSALIRSHQTEEERKSKYNNYTVEFI